ncbi:MAG TPA: hypothetical protein VFA20_26695 [Myxococcaceae bacterium]|nr:hypothetical protein [Myxococcaceae bacterium]
MESFRYLRLCWRGYQLAGENVLPQREVTGTPKGTLAIESLPEDDGEGELVCSRVHRLAAMKLLRRHIGRRSEHCAGARDGELERREVRLGNLFLRRCRERRSDGPLAAHEAEVGDPGPLILPDEDVVRLEVAVDEVRAVCGRQTVASGADERDYLMPATRPFLQPARQGAAGHVFHGDEDLVVHRTDVKDRDHVRVGEASQRLCLSHEACSRRFGVL